MVGAGVGAELIAGWLPAPALNQRATHRSAASAIRRELRRPWKPAAVIGRPVLSLWPEEGERCGS